MNLRTEMKLYKLTTPTFHLEFRTSFSLSCDTHVGSVNLLNYTLIPVVGRGSDIDNLDVNFAGRVVPTYMEVPGIPTESCASDYATKKSK